METAMVALVALMGLSFIGMAVAIFFDKLRLMDFFLFDVYGAWRGGPCAKFYKPVINFIKLWKVRNIYLGSMG